MPRWRPFEHRDFRDQPRILYVVDADRCLLFECQFDDVLDDYRETYDVFLMPQLQASELSGSWQDLHRRALRMLGTVSLPRSAFDPSLRERIDLSVLDLPPPDPSQADRHSTR